MSFETYSPQEFAENELFRRWVLYPTKEISAYWELFLSIHPEKQHDVLKAKALILAIHKSSENSPDEGLQEDMWENIAARIHLTGEKGSNQIQFSWKWYGSLVATLVLIATGSFWFYQRLHQQTKKQLTYDYLIHKQPEKLVEIRNTASADFIVHLPDSSTVVLTRGSRMSYSANFTTNRIVFLEGDGFFEVQKNPARPFVVYAGQLVTKVVGTSFWIRNSIRKDSIEVDVKSGCVAVAVANSTEEAFSDIKPQFLLVASQRAMYSSLDNRLKRSLTVNPLPINPPKVFTETIYTDKPAIELFEEMEAAYGLDIVFDPEELKKCRINTSFSDETFFQRLDIICRVLNAQYQIVETQIVIKGKPCE